MTEKEKLIEIIKQNGTYNGRSMGVDYYVVDANWIAELIIKNGFGDVSEWKDKYQKEKSRADRWKQCAKNWAESFKEDEQ